MRRIYQPMINKICLNFNGNLMLVLGGLILLVGLLTLGQFGCSGIEKSSGGTDDDADAPFTGTFTYYQDVNNRDVSHILRLVQKGNSITGTLEVILDDSYYDCCQTTATSQITGKTNGTMATLTFAGLDESCFCRNTATWGDEDGIYDEISYSVASGYTVRYTLGSNGNMLEEHCDEGTCARKCTIKRSGVAQKEYCIRWCPLEYARK